jgi:hypothetical protein
MKKILATVLLASGLLAGAAMTPVFAQKVPEPLSIQAELDSALQEMSATQLGTLTMGDLEKLMGRISVAQQKLQYVQRARRASFMTPGVGQFMTGDALGGSLFLAGDIAVVAGSIVGAYFLLPANVQFNSLDYLNAPLVNIHNAWQANSILSYLPSFGVLAGGAILRAALGHFSAVSAAHEARQNIADGKVTFAPNFDFDRHRFGMGMMMRF